MECSNVQEQLPAYIDEELTEAEHGLLAEHLHSCEFCAAELATLQAVIRLVGELPEVEPPPDFRERLYRRLAVEATREKVSLWHSLLDWVRQGTYRGLTAVVASALIVFFSLNGIVALQSGNPLISLVDQRAGLKSDDRTGVTKEADKSGEIRIMEAPDGSEDAASKELSEGYGMLAAPAVEGLDIPPDEGQIPAGLLTAPDIRGGAASSPILVTRGDKTVHRVKLAVVVEDLVSSQNQVHELAALNNGAVAVITYQYAENNAERGRQITLQVPEEAFTSVLAQLEGLGTVTAKEVTEVNVAMDAAAVENRLRNVQHQADLLASIRETESDPVQVVRLENEIDYVKNELLFNQMSMGNLHNAQVELVLVKQ